MKGLVRKSLVIGGGKHGVVVMGTVVWVVVVAAEWCWRGILCRGR